MTDIMSAVVLYTNATEHTELVVPGDVGLSVRDGPMVEQIQVAFDGDMWWTMPSHVSEVLLEMHRQGLVPGYAWDWGEKGRKGSWCPEGKPTAISRYILDFDEMIQLNLDSKSRRSFRVIEVKKEDAGEARFTGEQLTKKRRQD